MADYNIRGDGLSFEEAKVLADSGQRLDEVFACDITGIMQEYDAAIDFIESVVVFGETEGFILNDWNFYVVGFEDGNILHLRIDGEVVEM